jgi:hypothetical protein
MVQRNERNRKWMLAVARDIYKAKGISLHREIPFAIIILYAYIISTRF